MNSNHRRLVLIAFLSAALLLSLWRLAGWCVRFASESLQMDLAAFYTAGEALNGGLSPYRNHADRVPAIWDGVDGFQHSRFLYPPQVAVLFRPLAWLSYAGAKRLWLALSLVCVAASMAIAGRVFGLGRRWGAILLAAGGAALFYPLLTHLERGQIDAVTLLLIVLASAGMGRRGRRARFMAGVSLCAATLLKLHCVYMLPFLAIRKKGWELLGYLCGGLAIAALTAATPGGIEGSLAYVTDELPRISRFGEGGTAAMRLPDQVLARQVAGLPEGQTIKDGVVYKRESFSFTSNGTLVRVVQRRLQASGIWISGSLLSALALVVLFGAIAAWQFGLSRPLQLDRRGEILYWQVVSLVVLLSAPLTWVMNLVWILPSIVVVLAELGRVKSWKPGLALGLGAVALTVIALPDGMGAPWMTPARAQLIGHKYIVGEGLLLLSLLSYVRLVDAIHNVSLNAHPQALR